MIRFTKFLSRFSHNAHGGTAIEYGVLAGILSIAFITCFAIFGDAMRDMIEYIGEAVHFN